ncbi:MAG: DNA-directed RNA polymerase subunit omega [Planctomycetaceae bacterium]|nr:DNA-directed RNA polymerase subunit omega [Planctomycetaceae bacterium]
MVGFHESGDSRMIEALKSDELIRKVGGRFKLTALVQQRWKELMNGARPLIDRDGQSDLEIAIREVMEDKITIDYVGSDISKPEQALR